MSICVSLYPAAISVSSPSRPEFLLRFHTHLLISAFPVFSVFFPLSSTPAETTIFLYNISPISCLRFWKDHALIPDPEGLDSQDRLFGWRNTFYHLMHTEVEVVVKAMQYQSSSRPTELLSTASQRQVLTNPTGTNKLQALFWLSDIQVEVIFHKSCWLQLSVHKDHLFNIISSPIHWSLASTASLSHVFNAALPWSCAAAEGWDMPKAAARTSHLRAALGPAFQCPLKRLNADWNNLSCMENAAAKDMSPLTADSCAVTLQE